MKRNYYTSHTANILATIQEAACPRIYSVCCFSLLNQDLLMSVSNCLDQMQKVRHVPLLKALSFSSPQKLDCEQS